MFIYSCLHGGKGYKDKSKTGERPNQFTNKIGCPCKIRLLCTADGEELEIVEFHCTHNHDISKDEFKFIPSQRKLDKTDEQEISDMIKLSANRKLIRQTFANKTGKNVMKMHGLVLLAFFAWSRSRVTGTALNASWIYTTVHPLGVTAVSTGHTGSVQVSRSVPRSVLGFVNTVKNVLNCMLLYVCKYIH